MAQTEIVYSDAINLAELVFRACFEHGVEDEVRTYGMCGNQLRACGSGLVGRLLLVDGALRDHCLAVRGLRWSWDVLLSVVSWRSVGLGGAGLSC